jgi:hypothetical protein
MKKSANKPSNNSSLATSAVARRAHVGEYVAWNQEGATIIAHGKVLREVIAAAKATGEPHPICEFVGPPRKRA